ncbi:MAG: riboflavin biosynthesis protein RibF [Clostridia bacterium]|nr:riboflavin biosynthesis protein RibF [Clostridia bacterium]
MKNAVILGTFDGLHIGHRAVIEKARGFNIIAVTFNMPPKKSTDASLGVLMTKEDRFVGLKDLGVTEIKALEFNEVCNIEPYDFLDMICREFAPELFVCGFNYRFGKGAKGDTKTLGEYCLKKGIELRVAEGIKTQGVTVSSTLIRDYISKGEIALANKLLYRPFGFTARVISGDKRGRELGFPTVNQAYPQELQRVRLGVYSSVVLIDGREYKAISNIGIRPTFETKCVMSETHILNFDDDLYGKDIRIEPKEFLREERKFADANELKEAVLFDIKRALE